MSFFFFCLPGWVFLCAFACLSDVCNPGNRVLRGPGVVLITDGHVL